MENNWGFRKGQEGAVIRRCSCGGGVIWRGLIVTRSTLSATTAYYVTKPHYFDLEQNYGSIGARLDALRDIDAALARVSVCAAGEHGAGRKEVLSVKAEAMYIKPMRVSLTSSWGGKVSRCP